MASTLMTPAAAARAIGPKRSRGGRTQCAPRLVGGASRLGDTLCSARGMHAVKRGFKGRRATGGVTVRRDGSAVVPRALTSPNEVSELAGAALLSLSGAEAVLGKVSFGSLLAATSIYEYKVRALTHALLTGRDPRERRPPHHPTTPAVFSRTWRSFPARRVRPRCNGGRSEDVERGARGMGCSRAVTSGRAAARGL